MKLLQKWYVQLGLALLAAVIFTIVLIIMDQRETGEEIFKTNVPAETGALQTVSIDLQASELTHVLVLTPDIESGWGEPDVYLEAKLVDPNGNVLVNIGPDVLFGGSHDADDYGSRRYTKKFEFNPEVGGTYTLEIKTLTEHVENVYITIGRRNE